VLKWQAMKTVRHTIGIGLGGGSRFSDSERLTEKPRPTVVSAPLSFSEEEREALESEFGDGLGATLSTAVSALRAVVIRLISAGATRKRLVQIGVARGYKAGYVRTVVSQILVRVPGGRKRRAGAGPKTPKVAYAILAFARELAGEQARRGLLAAAHLAKVEDERGGAGPHASPTNSDGPIPVVVQIVGPKISPLILKS